MYPVKNVYTIQLTLGLSQGDFYCEEILGIFISQLQECDIPNLKDTDTKPGYFLKYLIKTIF